MSNLIQHVPSGMNNARGWVGGKLFYKSLRRGTFSIAKFRLHDLLKKRRTIL